MEDPRWLRLITIGLVLSALAVGYFLLTGRFTSTKTNNAASTAQPSEQIQVAQASPSPAALGVSSKTGSAKGGVSTLPNTGFPASLTITFAASALAVGFGLRKYPN